MRNKYGTALKIFGIFLFIFFLNTVYQSLSSQPSEYENRIVEKIEFQGLRNVDAEDVKHIMITTVGFPLKSVEIREDIKRIFAMGKFLNVQVEVGEFGKGVRVRLNIEERPLVDKIVFRGIDELNETDLLAAINFKEGDAYREELINTSVKLIKEKYDTEGFFNSHITHKLNENESKHSVQVIFIIDEGEEIKVRRIAILGAKKIYTGELQRLFETKVEGTFTDGSFKRDVYEEDKRKIIGYYQQNGYLDAQIVDERIDFQWVNPEKKNERGIFIVLKLSEGERYYLDKEYDVTINEGEESVFSIYQIEALKKSFTLNTPGEVFDNSKFLNDRQSISFLYASRGYIFARVIPRRTITEREVEIDGKKELRKFVHVEFVIDEGKKAYIEQIVVKGNIKTKTKVITRELVIREGELFDSTRMQLSRERVYNLGFFKEVNFDVRPGSKDGNMNLVIEVEEQPSGTISLGGGYGTGSGFSIFADIQENNFLGNGQILGVKFEYGPQKTSVTLSFQESWLFNYPVAFSSSIFYYVYNYDYSSIFPESNDKSSYKKQGIGYSLGLSYRFWYYWSVGMGWTHTFKSYLDPSGNSPDAIFLTVDQGNQEKRALRFYTYRDSKDNYLNPTRGFRTGVSVTMVGGYLLRGDDHYLQTSPEFYIYYSPFHLPFLKTHPTVLEFRVSGDFITPPLGKSWLEKNRPNEKNEWLENDDRLEIGGPETVRGWDYYDSDLPDSWRYAGLYHRILYGLEYRVPIEPSMLWVALFFDAGSLWSDKYWEKNLSAAYRGYVDKDLETGDLRRIDQFFNTNFMSYFIYSYGIGLKVQIPMMPLRFWFGKKMIYDGGFKTVSGFNFQFSIGDIRY